MSTAAARAKRTDPYYVAQDILSRRDNSVHEMQTKLARKGFTKEEIAKVIGWLRDKKLLDDQQFAHRYVIGIVRGKAVGKRWLGYKLKQRGIAQSIIEETLSELVTPETEKELVQRAAESWRQQHPKYQEDTPRLQRFLTSRGFSFEAIATVT